MPFNVDQPAYQSLRAIVSERTQPIVFWCGAGLSQPAGLPSWGELREKLMAALRGKAVTLEEAERNAQLRHADNIETIADPWLAFERLREVLRETTFNDTISEALAKAARVSPPQNYKKLWRIRPAGILTLNVDRLVTQAAVSTDGISPPIEFSGFQAGDYLYTLKTSSRPFIANLHGVYENRGSWVFTRGQLKALLQSGGYREFIRSCFASKTIVFVGVSADDVAAGGLLEDLRDHAKGTGTHFWVTHRSDGLADNWAESAGIRVIRYGTTEGDHREFTEMLDDLNSFVPKETFAEPVVIDSAGAAGALPPPGELAAMDANRIRQLLNAKAGELLTDHSQESYEAFEAFCAEYDEAIYRAWYVNTDPGRNKVFDYELEELLAGGAFGRVYRARRGESSVALKVLHQEIRGKAESVQSFRRGVRSMRILTDRKLDGVVRFLDASEIPAMVIMDYVPGPTLSQAVQAHQLTSWEEILTVAVRLARIIDNAHCLPERVLHRDIRPNNVIIRDHYNEPGSLEVVVLDFDLSWHKGALEKSVTHGATPAGYLAPEQLTRVRGVSTRHAAVDSFGLGMTLFYMVAGRDPFPAEHEHRNWNRTVCDAADRIACSEWQSLPRRFARVIQNATQNKQSSRWDFYQIIAELESLSDTLRDPRGVQSAEYLAEELATRTPRDFKWQPDRLESSLMLPSGIKVTVGPDDDDRSVTARLVWEATGVHEHKRVGKWLPTALEAAGAAMTSAGWKVSRAASGQRGEITGVVSSTTPVNLSKLAAGLDLAIAKLRFD